ncbi:hypothetical protein TYRP_005686 [Tyrophagus putrescentiae]|nr:hypothetical protein TYRP_005686 [Tyrophagus putrescentiae]
MASSSSQKYVLIDLYSEEEASGAGVETVGNEYEEVLVNFEEQALLLESTSIENSNLVKENGRPIYSAGNASKSSYRWGDHSLFRFILVSTPAPLASSSE